MTTAAQIKLTGPTYPIAATPAILALAGEMNGQPYWTKGEAEADSWELYWTGASWRLTYNGNFEWGLVSENPFGVYEHGMDSQGSVIVSEFGEGSDPLSKVYNTLWSALESNAEFTSLVAAGNRIKFSGTDTSPIKDNMITEDFPEVRIIPISTTPHSNRSSNSSSLVKQFAVQMLSGDQRVTANHFPLEWLIFRLMTNHVSDLFELEWSGHKFVKNVKSTNGQDSFSMSTDLKPGIRGWISVWTCEIEMWFPTNLLI